LQSSVTAAAILPPLPSPTTAIRDPSTANEAEFSAIYFVAAHASSIAVGNRLSGVRLNSTIATVARTPTASSRARRSWVVASHKAHPPPWKSITTGGGSLSSVGRTRRKCANPLGPIGAMMSSVEVMGFPVGLACMATKAARASAIGSSPIWEFCTASPSTNSWVVGSSGGGLCACPGTCRVRSVIWPSVFRSMQHLHCTLRRPFASQSL